MTVDSITITNYKIKCMSNIVWNDAKDDEYRKNE